LIGNDGVESIPERVFLMTVSLVRCGLVPSEIKPMSFFEMIYWCHVYGTAYKKAEK
jgi:hypothetical protein